jgi:hypothetical protein
VAHNTRAPPIQRSVWDKQRDDRVVVPTIDRIGKSYRQLLASGFPIEIPIGGHIGTPGFDSVRTRSGRDGSRPAAAGQHVEQRARIGRQRVAAPGDMVIRAYQRVVGSI